MATIHDVAHEAGVSISTVSYALTGKRRVSDTTRLKVEAAVKKLKYQPNAGARMLGGTRSRIFALTAPLRHDTNSRAHMDFVLAIVTAARKYDYDVLLLTEDEASAGLARVAKTRLVDGILVLDVTADDERVELLRGLDIPSVVVGVPDNTDGLVCVDLDFVAAGQNAVRTLAEYGHRKIGLIGQRKETYDRGANFPQRMREGFDSASAQRGIETSFVYGEAQGSLLWDQLEQLFASDTAPSALVLNCDEVAQKTVERFVQEKGLVVPQDLSLLSVGTSFNSEELSFPLDSIPLVPADSCNRAVELAIQQLDALIEPRVELITPQYHSYGSIGPVKA